MKNINKIEKIKINTSFIKLDSLLKLSGEAITGGQAKILILSNKILVNGEICTMRGKKIRPGDVVSIPELNKNFEVISE